MSKRAEERGLEEAARLYAIPHYMKDIDVNHIEEYPYDSGLEAAFIAGAKWQKGHKPEVEICPHSIKSKSYKEITGDETR